MADDTIAALMGDRLASKQSTLRYRDHDVFELVVAGSKMANFLVSSDGRTCLVCMEEGKDMSDPSNHKPFCHVRRWIEAASKLTVSGGSL
jgi:hypothetical protein